MEQASLVRLTTEFVIEVEWRGFELHPETPIGGLALTQLFGGQSLESLRSRMASFAAEFGVDIAVPQRLCNTRRALAMSEFARDHGKLDGFRDEVTRAYWLRDEDLEDEGVLRGIASRVGLHGAEALEASESKTYVDRVLQTRADGIDQMVSGVPILFVQGMPIVGCQRYETYETVLTRAGATRR